MKWFTAADFLYARRYVYHYSMWSLVRVFSKNDKIFRQEKNTLNNERDRDLLISILSYDEVSAFLLRVKTWN